MRRGTLIALLLCLWGSAQAQTVDAKVKTQAQGFLKKMAAIETKAKAIEPMTIPLKGRTAAQDKEMMRRIDFLDTLYNSEVRPLTNEVSRAQLPGPLNPVRAASEALDSWVNTKLQLQNAGVNNPGLESLKKREPAEHKAYLDAYKLAQGAVK